MRILAALEPAAPGLWFYNWRIGLEARLRLDDALAPLDMRAKDFWLLAIAGAGNIAQHELAEVVGRDASTLVAVLDGLERRGWLRRQRNPSDRRVQWVQRTPEGDRIFQQAAPLAQSAEARHMAVLSATDRDRLFAAMRRLVMSSEEREMP
jgi:DNA-binding MarR family transcriptional regulator